MPKTILVDGPERGRVIETSSNYVVVPKVRPITLAEIEGTAALPDFETIIYTIRRVSLFGRTIYVGTVDPSEAHDFDLFEALASNTAKDVAL